MNDSKATCTSPRKVLVRKMRAPVVNSKRVPRSIRIQIAGIAVTDPRTVDRYLFTREPMRPVAETAVRRALVIMGIPDPRARQ